MPTPDDKLQEIIDRAVEGGATSVTVEFAKEGGLEVCFMFGETGVGGILVDRNLEADVMTLIAQRAGLDRRPTGVMHCASRGKELDIHVEEYNSFGETAFTLTFPIQKR